MSSYLKKIFIKRKLINKIFSYIKNEHISFNKNNTFLIKTPLDNFELLNEISFYGKHNKINFFEITTFSDMSDNVISIYYYTEKDFKRFLNNNFSLLQLQYIIKWKMI
jgi:hypothetical protein